MANYIITGVTHQGVRIKPILCTRKPAQHTGHLQSGTIWKAVRHGYTYRKLVRRFTNNELCLLP